MSVKDKVVNDKTAYDYNVFTDELDLIRKFNPDRIVTSEYNSAGSRNMIYDPASRTFIDAGPSVVVDNNGNVVVVGK